MTLGGISPNTPNAVRLMAELEFLNELCHVVASNSELQPILDWIVNKTTTMLRADEGSIRLLGPEGQGQPLKTLIRRDAFGITSGSWPPAIATSVMGFLMIKNGEPLATPDLIEDARFPALKGMDTRIRSALAVPLRVGNQFTGMLAVTQSTPGRAWKQDEVQLLSIVAANSAGVIEQARLREEQARMHDLEVRMQQQERELGVARDIQMSLLPPASLRLGPWEAFGRVVPAREVGGDSFDYYALRNNRLAVSIADVSGKGVGAALLMSNLQGSLRSFCDGRRPIPDAVAEVNQNVVERCASTGKFITMFYGELDHEQGVLRYVNAGHNYPLIRRADGSLVELAEGGLPLGIMVHKPYTEGEVAIGPGESLLLFSDGISEALDARSQEFGDDRLRAVWQKHGDQAPDQFVELMMKEVQAFRGPAPQSDDMTLVVVGGHR